MKKSVFCAALFLIFFHPTVYSSAMQFCVADHCYEPKATVGELEVPLRGASLFRYMGFRLYTAALYSSAPADQWMREFNKNASLKLVIRYLRPIKKASMAKAAEKNIKLNPNVRWSDVRERVERISQAYEDVDFGDEYALSYIPEKGTFLERNGEEIILVPGDDFARAYFAIWVSEHSINPKFTQKLLSLE